MADSPHTKEWIGIVEDGLDVAMALGSVAYIVLINETPFELSTETMAGIGGTGGILRLALRRLIRRIVRVRLERTEA